MNRKVEQTIRQYNMLAGCAVVYAAVSGGADSVALLHVLGELQPVFGYELRALHYNHRLRGAESDRDEAFVRALCANRRVPLTVGRATPGLLVRRRGQSVEERARKARYAFFSAHTAGAARIATAHTRSDNVETVLLNLSRGTGLRGLCGIPPVRGRVIRPLIRCGRADIEAYCAKHRLQYVTDSSNFSMDYTRNRIRHEIIPRLSVGNAQFERHVAGLTEMLRVDADYLDAAAVKAFTELCLEEGRYDRAGLRDLPRAIRPRVILHILRAHGLRRNRARVRLLEKLLRDGKGAVQLSKMQVASCTPSFLIIAAPRGKPHRRPPAPGFFTEIDIAHIDELTINAGESGKNIRLIVDSLENMKKNKIFQENLLKNCMDCDRIEKIVRLGFAASSDRLRLVGRGCTKTMKNLWAEAGVPPSARDSWLKMTDRSGRLLWVEQFGVDESVCITEYTLRAAYAEILRD